MWTWTSIPVVAALVLAPTTGLRPHVAHHADEAAASGGTLRVAMLAPSVWGFDPTSEYGTAEYAVTRLLQRTLLTHRGVPGFQGTRLVPDLATALPTISSDGLTWTFHIRPGIHYAPPLQDVEVTAPDFIRALERARPLPKVAANALPTNVGPGSNHLPTLLAGFADYAQGRSSTISGAVALDAHTLQLRTIHRDEQTLGQVMAMAFTAPIPPSPRPDSPLGIATGHDLDIDYTAAPPAKGFGPFQSATGPYMIEGADRIDYHDPPDQQQWPTGFVPSWWYTAEDDGPPKPGRLVLVRNPSWEAGSDPARPAYPDRIEITIQPAKDPYNGPLAQGEVDAAIGAPPSRSQLMSVPAASRSRVSRVDGSGVDWIMMNLLQPPFDDVHVRRAFSMAVDREVMTTAWVDKDTVERAATSRVVPPVLTADLLAADGQGPKPESEIRAEMRKSRYWSAKGCLAAACRPVIVGGYFDSSTGLSQPAAREVLSQALRRMGLQPKVLVPCEVPGPHQTQNQCDHHNDVVKACVNSPSHAAICPWGWFYDYPAAADMFPPFEFQADVGWSATGLGLSPQQIRDAGFPVLTVPSVTQDIQRCSAELPVQAVACWARLDQWLTDKVVAVVPFTLMQSVRMYGSGVMSASMDQATGEYALDRMVLAQS